MKILSGLFLLCVILAQNSAMAEETMSFESFFACEVLNTRAKVNQFSAEEIEYLTRFFSQTPESERVVTYAEYKELLDRTLKKYPLKVGQKKKDEIIAYLNSQFAELSEKLGIEQTQFNRQAMWLMRIQSYESNLLNEIRTAGMDARLIDKRLTDQRDHIIPAAEGVWNLMQERLSR